MLARLSATVKDPEKRAIISWIGGGAVATLSLLAAFFSFVSPDKPDHEQAPTFQGVLTGQLTAKDEQIKELMKQNAVLTKSLLERHPPAGRAGRQAVGEAVQSISQGAEAGDSRLEKRSAF